MMGLQEGPGRFFADHSLSRAPGPPALQTGRPRPPGAHLAGDVLCFLSTLCWALYTFYDEIVFLCVEEMNNTHTSLKE